ncbi:hypothetical protein [Deinococcus sp.]|uniref:hypothetical protein n=1 Tax=Deinococcus sp. TaxID=47478 RepID=UPI003C7C8736
MLNSIPDKPIQQMTFERLRTYLLQVRREEAVIALRDGKYAPAQPRSEVIEQFPNQYLAEDGVIRSDIWRERLFSPTGADVSSLNIRLTYSNREQLELFLPDHEMEIMLGAPIGAKAPGGIHLWIDLGDPENEAWSVLRLWGAEIIPDPPFPHIKLHQF